MANEIKIDCSDLGQLFEDNRRTRDAVEKAVGEMKDNYNKINTETVLSKNAIEETQKDLNGLGAKVSKVDDKVRDIDRTAVRWTELEERFDLHKKDNCLSHSENVKAISIKVDLIPGQIAKGFVISTTIISFIIIAASFVLKFKG